MPFQMAESLSEKLSDLKLDEYKKVDLYEITKDHIGSKIKTFGWITAFRAQAKISFFDLTAGFKTVKCVYSGKIQLTQCTSLTVYATVSKNYGKDKHDFELQVSHFEIYNNEIAPSFPLNDESSPSSFLDYGHLALRTKKRGLFLRARSTLLKILRDFYYEKKYTEITPPTLVQTQVEGGSTLFKLDYYGEPAYLTQSSQLYLETVAPVAHKACCIAPSYRAEKSKTRRHLSEYTHVEAELCDINFSDLCSEVEKLVSYAMKKFYEIMKDDILEVYPDFEFLKVPEEEFKKVTYSEAIDILRGKGYLKEDKTEFEQGDDIPDAAERYLVEEIGNGLPVMLTKFWVEHKAFYMRKDEENPKATESVDLLFPGVGEILGGSMRKDKYEDLLEGFKREGIEPEPYYWYLDMAKYGPSLHGGYGLGFERFLMGLMRYDNVDQACLYARKVNRCAP